jgi:3',5'-cyclic AMP phosphodiesterase CpdA
MVNRNLERFIRRTIYSLKRQYGAEVDAYKVLSSTTDLCTGEKGNRRSRVKIKKCIVLPTNLRRKVVQNISVISADKEFVYGGSFDANLRDLLIDNRDLPSGYEFVPEDYFVFSGVRWNIVAISKYEYNTAWIISVSAAYGAALEDTQVLDIAVETEVELDSEGTGEIA